MRLDESASRGWLVKTVACGGCAVAGIYLIGLFLGAIFVPLRTLGQSKTCQSNLYLVTRAFRTYSDDYDQRFPPSASWMDRMRPYVPQERRFHCPTVSQPGGNRYGYAMSDKVGERLRSDFTEPDNTAIIYDSTNLARSAHDKVTTVPRPGRHMTQPRKDSPSRRGDWVGYVGGNVRFGADTPGRK